MRIYHVPNCIWSGESMEIGERDGVPPDWIVGPTPPEAPEGKIVLWASEWLIAAPLLPPMPSIEDICRQIDTERDRRTALDFAYDFGLTPAVDDNGVEIAAGVRLLQMRPEDQRNWQALQGAALTAVVSDIPEMLLPMRAEDNWNVQTTAMQVLQVLAAMTAHASALLFYGGSLKSQVRVAADPTTIDWQAGWPAN